MQIIVDDLLVHYELIGKGRLVLLLHGWGDNAKGLKVLQQSLGGKYQVLAIDLPGFGASQAPEDAWGLDEYAKLIAHALEKLGLSDLYAVIGHSNGGAIAIRGTATKALKPQKLILLAASGVRNQQSARRGTLRGMAKAGRAATFWLPASRREGLRKKLYGAVGSDLLVAPGMEDTFKKIIKQDVQADCQEITQTTLLVYGDNDQDTPVAFGERYHELIKNSELKVVSAGHFVHIDQKEQVLDTVREFLK